MSHKIEENPIFQADPALREALEARLVKMDAAIRSPDPRQFEEFKREFLYFAGGPFVQGPGPPGQDRRRLFIDLIAAAWDHLSWPELRPYLPTYIGQIVEDPLAEQACRSVLCGAAGALLDVAFLQGDPQEDVQ